MLFRNPVCSFSIPESVWVFLIQSTNMKRPHSGFDENHRLFIGVCEIDCLYHSRDNIPVTFQKKRKFRTGHLNDIFCCGISPTA